MFHKSFELIIKYMHVCCESLNKMYFFTTLHHCSYIPCPKPSTSLVYNFCALTVYLLLQKSYLIPSPVFLIHPSFLDLPSLHLNSLSPHAAGVPLNCNLGMGAGRIFVLTISKASD